MIRSCSVKEDHVIRLADRLQEGRRTLEIREEDDSERVRRWGVTDGIVDPAEEPQDVVLGDADDLVRDETVRLPVYSGQRLAAGAWARQNASP